MKLPNEIHEILRFHPEPGDSLILRNTEYEIDTEIAWEIKKQVRIALGLPSDFPILVLGWGWEASVGKMTE